jgi:hypothetical protein
MNTRYVVQPRSALRRYTGLARIGRLLLCVLPLTAPSLLSAQSPIVAIDAIGPTADEAGTADPFPSPRFGQTVAISGRVAMASMPGDLATDPNEFGRVAVFEKTKARWNRTATLLGAEESGGDFGRAIDIEADRAVVSGAKALYLYERRGRAWVQVGKTVLRSDDASFGDNVELERGLIIARVSRSGESGTMASVLHVYEWQGPHGKYGADGVDGKHAVHALTRIAVIRPQDGSMPASFGADVAMDGRFLVVGAPEGADTPGSTYVYAHFAHRWIQIDRLSASDGTVGDGFGAAVAIRNAVIVIGAPNADLGIPDEQGAGPPRGNVYVFLPHRRGWYESQQLNDPADANPIRGLGHEVSLGRDLLAVRVPDTSGLMRGEARVFVYDWKDRSFQLPQRVAAYEGLIPDIDMSGRQLILSRHDAGVFNYYVRGSATIYAFGASSPAAAED